MEAEWKYIEGYGDNYMISNTGIVKSMPRVVNRKGKTLTVNGKILEQKCDRRGQLSVTLRLYRPLAHLKHSVAFLVAKHFVPNPNNWPTVKFKDGNHKNIVSTNLKWDKGK